MAYRLSIAIGLLEASTRIPHSDIVTSLPKEQRPPEQATQASHAVSVGGRRRSGGPPPWGPGEGEEGGG